MKKASHGSAEKRGGQQPAEPEQALSEPAWPKQNSSTRYLSPSPEEIANSQASSVVLRVTLLRTAGVPEDFTTSMTGLLLRLGSRSPLWFAAKEPDRGRSRTLIIKDE